MPGFEPGNGGIKIRCLTTWLHPIIAVWKTGARAPAERHHNQSPKGRQWYVAMRPRGACGRLDACAGMGRRLRGIWTCHSYSNRALAAPPTDRYNAPLPGASLSRAREEKPKFRLSVGRSVAQPGSALASGARGRRFESSRSDQSFFGTVCSGRRRICPPDVSCRASIL